ncbi:MAG: NADPH-dependent 7-cyano-7-deazaguanine reductase QueF [Nitratiruptor sp.]|nr:NADPH-dependent 7-cyano-7-deazaguanine reductase QueF [Nitratiruptor sp.]NPA82924.1 NADPH-dependent 7-cyano-7-deazaguanine reductase QueF [Campylobacterota bacterium]
MRYGEAEIANFDPERDLEVWPNNHDKRYKITITLPEFSCLCPRSGYPDYATFTLEYIPDRYVVELKALKLYINSFRNRYISHEDSVNEVFDTLYAKLQPRWMRLVADFNPRGNVHTTIEIDSATMEKESP